MKKKKDNIRLDNHSKGRDAEALAINYFKTQKGMNSLAQNYRTHDGEIDCICYSALQKMVVFVEVKSGDSCRFEAYKEAINQRKKDKIVKVALKFLENLEVEYDEVRFDAFFVERGAKEKVFHIENIIVLR